MEQYRVSRKTDTTTLQPYYEFTKFEDGEFVAKYTVHNIKCDCPFARKKYKKKNSVCRHIKMVRYCKDKGLSETLLKYSPDYESVSEDSLSDFE